MYLDVKMTKDTNFVQKIPSSYRGMYILILLLPLADLTSSSRLCVCVEGRSHIRRYQSHASTHSSTQPRHTTWDSCRWRSALRHFRGTGTTFPSQRISAGCLTNTLIFLYHTALERASFALWPLRDEHQGRDTPSHFGLSDGAFRVNPIVGVVQNKKPNMYLCFAHAVFYSLALLHNTPTRSMRR